MLSKIFGRQLGFQVNHWHLELSSKCTLRCPRCPRNEGLDPDRMGLELTLKDIKNIFSEEFINVDPLRITLCGDLGDPIYATEFLEIIKYLKSNNPRVQIYIITNGSYKKAQWWEQLGQLLNSHDTVAFSIDGYDQESNNKYRVNSNFDSIVTGITTLHKTSSAYLVWASIVFAFNEDKIDTIKELATRLGIDELQITKSTKFGEIYDDYRPENGVDPLQPSKKWLPKGHRYERNAIRLSDKVRDTHSYEKALLRNAEVVRKKYGKHILPLCLIGNRGLFVSADGQVWPCSWVSFPHNGIESPLRPGKLISFKDSFFIKNRDSFNVKTKPVAKILKSSKWNRLFAGFNDPKKSFVECEQKCFAGTITDTDITQYNTN